MEQGGTLTPAYMHLLNDIAEFEPVQSALAIDTSETEADAQAVLDDLATKVKFNTYFGSKTAIGEHAHNLNENNVNFSLNYYTVTTTYKHYSSSTSAIYTNFEDDSIFAWTYEQ